LLGEQPLGVAREVDTAFVLVGFVGILMSVDFALITFFAPRATVRHCLEEGGVHLTVELVDVNVDSILKPLVFGLMTWGMFSVLQLDGREWRPLVPQIATRQNPPSPANLGTFSVFLACRSEQDFVDVHVLRLADGECDDVRKRFRRDDALVTLAHDLGDRAR
jgi:hypothetical protein